MAMGSRREGFCSSALLADAQNRAWLQQDVKSKKFSSPQKLPGWCEKVGYTSRVYANIYKNKSGSTWPAEVRAVGLGETVWLLPLYANHY